MNDSLLNQFLKLNVSIRWNTDEELDQLAEFIDKATGFRHGRRYSRGYSSTQYPHVAFDKTVNMLILYRSPQGVTHYNSVDAFLADLLIEDEDDTAIDIENML